MSDRYNWPINSGHDHLRPAVPESKVSVRAKAEKYATTFANLTGVSKEELRADGLGDPGRLRDIYGSVAAHLDNAPNNRFTDFLPGTIVTAWREEGLVFAGFRERSQQPQIRTFCYEWQGSDKNIGLAVHEASPTTESDTLIQTTAFNSLMALLTVKRLMEVSFNPVFRA